MNQDVTDGHILGIQGLNLSRGDLSHEIAQIAGRIESGYVDDLVRVGVMSNRDTAVDFTRLAPHEWPEDEHDEFIRLAQTLDTLSELFEAFPHRKAMEIMEKAEAMGCLTWLVMGERMSDIEEAHERHLRTFDA